MGTQKINEMEADMDRRAKVQLEKTREYVEKDYQKEKIERIVLGETFGEWILKQRKKYFPNSLKG